MSDTLVIDIVLIAVLVVICIAVGVLSWQALRKRRDQLRSEIDASHASVEERAFNKIQLGRSAADHLERSGTDVAGPRRLLDQASRSFESGRHDDALALASSAHATLLKEAGVAPVVAPDVPVATAPADSSADPPIVTEMSPVPDPDPSAGTAPPAPGRLPKNKAESHFQIRLLDEELAAGGPSGTPPATVRGVTAITADAHAAYERADYTEALRLSLKGRRTLGARVESLPPSSAAPVGDPAAPAALGGSDRCTKCGQPLRASDKFCRGCGNAVAASACPRCGEPLDGADQFCGRCGAPRP